MEGNEMMKIYKSYPVLVHLIKLREDPRLTSAMKDQIQILEQGLQFLVIYRELLSLHAKQERPVGKYLNFGEMSRIDATKKRKGITKLGLLAMESRKFKDWDTLASELLDEINSYKPSIREDCSFFSEGLYSRYLFTTDSLVTFMRYTDVSMANVLQLKGDMIPVQKMKFESLKEKLNMLRMVFHYVKEDNTNCLDFLCALNTWVRNAAYLCLLYWILDENMTSDGNLMLSKMYKNFDFCHPKITEYCLNYLRKIEVPVEEVPVEECCQDGKVVFPKVTRMSLSYPKATNPLHNKRREACEIYFGFIESLHWNLRGYLPRDAIEMLLDAMLFLIAFVTDPLSTKTVEGRLALAETKEALKEVGTLIISLDSGEKDEAEIVAATNFLFHDFLEMISRIKAKVRKTHPLIFLDPSFNFPRLDMVILIDSSIEKLKESPFHFPKHPILTFEKGLVVLRDLLKASNLKDNYVLELQNECLGLKDLWTRISNVAYHVDRIIESNSNKDGFGLDIFFLLDVQEELKHLCPKVKRIKNKYLQDSYTSKSEMNSIDMAPLKFDAQEMDELIVGFDNKVKEIRDWLTHGSKNLDIISIFGMAGLGKTTLAKKVYNDPSVKSHFTACAWCTVSQSYNSKKLMLDILKDIIEVNDSFIRMEEEDLADKLRKCLKGQRYLIVMDDMWGIDAWNALKLSFPDDQNHSRILFTSRINNVVLGAKSDSYPYPLTRLSNQESFELLERRLYHVKDICPRKFVEYGKKIARDCKGLPLAVVLVAGLLKKEIDNLDWWKQVGENLGSRISKGGCSHILELSYKHLSEPLKACLLYLGLFQEDEVIQVRKLINLWVSEGFIQVKEKKNVESVAKEYVMDLISRSLLIVSDKNSRGGVKTCVIHDLLREFCREKSREEHFFKLLHGKNISLDAVGDHYRVSIESQHLKHFVVQKSSPLHSIHICATGTFNAFNISPSSLCNAIYLHVLNLEDVRFMGDFPEEVTTLIFLRYLAIWCTNKFNLATIGSFKKLETLRIIREEEFIFPAEILEIESLRHVHVGKFSPHVKHSTITRRKNNIQMKNIQSFSTPYLTDGAETESLLCKLKIIQKLKCRLYEQKKVVKLDFLNRLVSLNMTHEGRPWLRNFGFSLPTSIKKLTLSNFSLPWSELSRIAKLQNLEVLKILVNAFKGNFWNMKAEEFKKLKFLKLQRLNVQEWSASEENFPCLQKIVIEHCYKLKEIPTEFAEISTLREIQIRRCRSPVVKSATEIEDQQMEQGNLNFKIEAVQILSEKFHAGWP